MNLIDAIGTIGVFQILLAYILNLAGKLNKNSLSFILLNMIGAGMACIASILMTYYPFIILEGVWTLVSVVALMRYIKRQSKPENSVQDPKNI